MTTLPIRHRLREFFFLKQAIAQAKEIASTKGTVGIAKARAARSLLGAAASLEDVSEWQLSAVVLLRQATVFAAQALAARQGLDVDIADLAALWSAVIEIPAVKATVETLSPEARQEVARVVALGLDSEQCDGAPSALRAQKDALFRIVHCVVPLVEADIYATRRLRSRVATRWIATACAFLVFAGLIVYLFQRETGHINIARGARVTASSTFRPDVYNPQGLVDGDKTHIGCHTEGPEPPWVLLDLGRNETVRRVVVTNRLDGNFPGYTVPLLVETSIDGTTFTQFARQDGDFKTWTATGKRINARYVRIRVPRPTVLHLNEIEVY